VSYVRPPRSTLGRHWYQLVIHPPQCGPDSHARA
jgi:hypothetical protein